MAPMKVMTDLKLELQTALFVTPLKKEITQALTVTLTILQWINSNEKQPIFVAHRVCDILEYTSVDQRNHIPTKHNKTDAGTRALFADILQISS